MGRKPKSQKAEIEKARTEFISTMAAFVQDTKAEFDRVLKLGKQKSGKEHRFRNEVDFSLWWAKQFEKQSGKCFYCESGFQDIAKLIAAGLLKERKTGHGLRGRYPEVDRMITTDGLNIYSRDNCVLVCYYCNNDKSNIYGFDEYKKFLAPAKGAFVRHLLEKLPPTRRPEDFDGRIVVRNGVSKKVVEHLSLRDELRNYWSLVGKAKDPVGALLTLLNKKSSYDVYELEREDKQ